MVTHRRQEYLICLACLRKVYDSYSTTVPRRYRVLQDHTSFLAFPLDTTEVCSWPSCRSKSQQQTEGTNTMIFIQAGDVPQTSHVLCLDCTKQEVKQENIKQCYSCGYQTLRLLELGGPRSVCLNCLNKATEFWFDGLSSHLERCKARQQARRS